MRCLQEYTIKHFRLLQQHYWESGKTERDRHISPFNYLIVVLPIMKTEFLPVFGVIIHWFSIEIMAIDNNSNRYRTVDRIESNRYQNRFNEEKGHLVIRVNADLIMSACIIILLVVLTILYPLHYIKDMQKNLCFRCTSVHLDQVEFHSFWKSVSDCASIYESFYVTRPSSYPILVKGTELFVWEGWMQVFRFRHCETNRLPSPDIGWR